MQSWRGYIAGTVIWCPHKAGVRLREVSVSGGSTVLTNVKYEKPKTLVLYILILASNTDAIFYAN